MNSYQQGYFLGWGAFVAVCATVALVICAGVVDKSGRKHNDRLGPVSEHVTQIDADQYLFDRQVKFSPTEFCRGGADPVDMTRVVHTGSLEGYTYVDCYDDQHFNDRREASPNFGTAIVRTLVNPAWWIPTALAFAAVLLYGLGCWVSSYGDRKRKRERVRVDLEQQRRELRQAWAKDEIDDLTFQTKMDKLYGQGVTPARDD